MGTRIPPASFADLLQRYRRVAGLTQEELAERAHLSVRGISNLERGVRRLPQRGTVTLLAEALRLPPAERAAFEAAARGLGELTGGGVRVGAPPLDGPAWPPLVGRSQEVNLLEQHLRGEGPLVLLLAGEPGIGKSRLLHEAEQRAASQGWQVLRGGCQRRGGQEPYAPLLEALERSLREQSSAQLRAALAGCAWMVRLLPELAAGPIEPLPAWTVSAEQERRLMFGAVARFLRNVAGPTGTLLVLDDLQWAGADALDLLVSLVRAAEAPVRVLGAYRDTEVGPQDPLSVVLADLAQAGLARQRALAPLAADEVRQLLEGLWEDVPAAKATVRERVLQRAGGVPFFVVSWAQGLRLGAGSGDAADAIPWNLTQGLRQRVAALPQASRELLGMAAVIGRVAPRTLLLELAAMPEGEVLEALDAIRRGRLLVEQGQSLEFAHDVIREVVEADLGVTRRAALHRRVLAVLEERSASHADSSVDRLAYHSMQAGEATKAAHYARLAGDRAVRMSAYRDAVMQYEVALELLEAGDLQARTELLDRLGEAMAPLGDTSLQLRYWLEAQHLYAQIGNPRKVGDLSWRLAIVYRSRGDFAAARDSLRAALTVLEAEPPGRELAATYSALSQLYVVLMQDAESIAWGQKALNLAAELGDTAITSGALINMGGALMSMGEVDRGRAHLGRGLDVAKGAGLVGETMRAYNNLGFCMLHLGEYRQARDMLRAGITLADRTGWETLTDYLRSNLGGVEMELGHWDEARDLLEQAARRSEAAYSAQRVWSVLRTGEILRRQGMLDEAGQMLEGILPACENWDDLESLGTCLASLALVRLARGDPAGAAVAMDRCIERWQSKAVMLRYDQALWRGVEVYTQVGREDQARALLEDLLAVANRVASPAARAYLADARGLLAAFEGRHGDAAAHFKEAKESWQLMGCPYQEACASRRRAESLFRSGDTAARAEAERELASARATFERLGARLDLEAVDACCPPLPSGTPGAH